MHSLIGKKRGSVMLPLPSSNNEPVLGRLFYCSIYQPIRNGQVDHGIANTPVAKPTLNELHRDAGLCKVGS